MVCPECQGALSETPGSPVSPYINTYRCGQCGWAAFRCGDTSCDGYLVHEGYGPTVRYNCVKCDWTGMGVLAAA